MSPLTRREVLRASLALPVAGRLGGAPAAPAAGRGGPAVVERHPHVVVVGAGAFGGWTALALVRRGARVTLVDAWGPGNSRASSGDESRVIRGMYGPDKVYVDWVVRSFEVWADSERRWGQRLYTPTGTLWMFRVDDGYARTSLPLLERAGLPVAELSPAEAAKRWPQIDFGTVRSVFFEERAGALAARRACRAVAEAVAAEGGEVLRAAARPGRIATDRGARMARLELADGSTVAADAFVFACGPWLGTLFPDAVGDRVRPTRQEVYYFGTPAGDGRFSAGSLPIWIDFGERIVYGIPGNEDRGFKVADDTRGEPFDPTTGDRTPTPALLEPIRRQLAVRFPGMAGAPLVEARVCQYENSPDGHFIIDRHPGAGNVVLVGGGSGHGFKLGPAVGEHAAGLALGDGEPLALFRLDRASARPGTQFERKET